MSKIKVKVRRVYCWILFVLFGFIIFNIKIVNIHKHDRTLANLSYYINQWSTNKIYPNHMWLFNHNTMQYSSYMFNGNSNNASSTTYEVLVVFNSEENEKKYYEKKDVKCLLIRQSSMNWQQPLELEIESIVRFQVYEMIFVCKMAPNKVIPYDRNNYNQSMIAIVLKKDFTQDPNTIEYHQRPYVLPYDMIKYQIPGVIRVPIEKNRAIAHCVHYTHDISFLDYRRILYWLKKQSTFGIRKIVLYDSHSNTWLKDRIKAEFHGTSVHVRPYNIHRDNICDWTRLGHAMNSSNPINAYKNQIDYDICIYLYYKYFSNPTSSHANRWRHQAINANDCYRSLRKTYEFVSYYDFDEWIMPRSYMLDDNHSNITKSIQCMDNVDAMMSSELCNQNPVPFSLYDYLKILIQTNLFDDKHRLSSIIFTNAVYLQMPSHTQILMKSLEHVLSNRHQMKFPFLLKYPMTLIGSGHLFNIDYNDIDYIEYITKTFRSLECMVFKNPSSSRRIDVNFMRFLFFTTESKHHLGKSVHFTDNVKVVFTHYSLYNDLNTVELRVPVDQGVLSHFRKDNFKLALNFNSSIRTLRLDLEYFFDLFRNLNGSCID
jgi:hypothetical protein